MPEKPDIDRTLDIARMAAREAGKIQKKLASMDFRVERKGLTDLVTDVDLRCEKAIVDIIKQTYPDHEILAEENGARHTGSDFKWIIDPLDGTTNYAHGFPVYCSSVALEWRGDIIVGAVFDVTRNEMFAAAKGRGARLNEQRISVSNNHKLIDSLLATGFPYTIRTEKQNNLPQFAAVAMRAQAVRRPGAAALDLCYVACGRLDGFWEFHLKPWDMAAGTLIVSEAGGKISGADGWNFSVYTPRIAATNGLIHQELVDVIKSV